MTIHDTAPSAAPNPSGKRLSIVISTGERSAMVYDCLRSLRNVGVPPEVEVVIVDAGRRDPVSIEMARALWPELTVLPFPEANLTRQRNAGTRQARGEFVCFLDDDTLLQPGWWPAIIEPLIGKPETGDLRPESDKSEGKTEGQCSTALCAESEEADHRSVLHQEPSSVPSNPYPITHNRAAGAVAIVAGAVWCNPSPAFTDKPGGYVSWLGIPEQVTHRSRNVPREVEWPVGCNMAFRKSVWAELGGLSELYGFYDEDIDFGLRARRAGYRVVFQPEAAVYHYCNLRPKVPVTKRKAFLQGRNRCMLLVRNYGLSLRLLLYLLTAPWIRLWEATIPVLRLWVTNYGHWGAYLAGMAAGFVKGIQHPTRREGRS